MSLCATVFAALRPFDASPPRRLLFLSLTALRRLNCLVAIGSKSFVLRGPPGCGKTQTLANMVAALVDEGKTVCVVAKLPVVKTLRPLASARSASTVAFFPDTVPSPCVFPQALGVFAEKLRAMQPRAAGGPESAGPSLRPLTTSFFTGKDGGKIRRSDDTQNAVTHDDRLAKWPTIRDLGRFWADEASGAESVVRTLLRDGWRLALDQPSFLGQFHKQGIVGVLLNKPKSKPKFVCSLCGKAQASEAPFEKHLACHVTHELWDPAYDARQVRHCLSLCLSLSFCCPFTSPAPLLPGRRTRAGTGSARPGCYRACGRCPRPSSSRSCVRRPRRSQKPTHHCTPSRPAAAGRRRRCTRAARSAAGAAGAGTCRLLLLLLLLAG